MTLRDADLLVNPWTWAFRKEPGFVIVTTAPEGHELANLLRSAHVNAIATPHVRVLWLYRSLGAAFAMPERCKGAFDHNPDTNPHKHPDKDHVEQCARHLMTANNTVVVLGPGWKDALRDGVTDDEVAELTGHVVSVMSLVWLLTERPEEHSGPPGFGKFKFRPLNVPAMGRELLHVVGERLRATPRVAC